MQAILWSYAVNTPGGGPSIKNERILRRMGLIEIRFRLRVLYCLCFNSQRCPSTVCRSSYGVRSFSNIDVFALIIHLAMVSKPMLWHFLPPRRDGFPQRRSPGYSWIRLSTISPSSEPKFCPLSIDDKWRAEPLTISIVRQATLLRTYARDLFRLDRASFLDYLDYVKVIQNEPYDLLKLCCWYLLTGRKQCSDFMAIVGSTILRIDCGEMYHSKPIAEPTHRQRLLQGRVILIALQMKN